MAADGAGAHRQVAVDQLAAATSEDRRPFDTAGPLLPVAAGGASNPTRGSSAAFCEELVYV